MDIDNSVYTVTPPSLFLNENGPSVLLVNFKEDKIKEICQGFEKLFNNNSITFYYSESPISDSTIAWFRAVVNMADYIVVNVSECNTEEMYTIMMSKLKIDTNIFWFNHDNKNKALVKLINSYDQKILSTVDQLIKIAGMELGFEDFDA